MGNTVEELDTLQDSPKVALKWKSSDKGMFPYTHSRQLPKEVAQKAIDYIAVLTEEYPFQIRYAMAVPLWKRFAQEWCDTGDEQKSLRVI